MRRRATARSTRRRTRSMPSRSTASATTFRSSSALMAHPRWRAGKLSTGFIAEEYPDGFRGVRAARRERARAGGGRGRDRPRARRAQAPHLRPDDRPRGDGASASARSWLDETEYAARGRRARTAFDRGRSFWTTAKTRAHASAAIDWRPASRSGPARVDGEPVAVQVRPIANGFDLRHARRAGRALMSTPSARPAMRG